MQENAGFGQTTVTLAHPDAADAADWPFVLARQICNNFLRDRALFDKSMKLCTEVDL